MPMGSTVQGQKKTGNSHEYLKNEQKGGRRKKERADKKKKKKKKKTRKVYQTLSVTEGTSQQKKQFGTKEKQT